MAFGSDYKVEEFSNKIKLDDGNYKAKIVKTEGCQGSNGNKYIKVELEVNGDPNNYPNMFCIFDSPKEAKGNKSLEELKSIWNKKMIATFDSFGITRGDFNFNGWVGKTGEITVQQQYSNPEFSEVVPYKTKPRERKPANPDFSSIGTVVSETPANATTDGFSEDLPF